MSPNLFSRRRAERFAQLLDEANGGPRHHARARTDEQLAELVAVGHQLSTVRSATTVDPEFRSDLRAMLVATAQREGIGVAARPESAEQAGSAGRAAPPMLARWGVAAAVAGRSLGNSGAAVAAERAVDNGGPTATNWAIGSAVGARAG